MIDLSEHSEHQIIRMAGARANILERLNDSMQIAMECGDNESVCAYATMVARTARTIAEQAAYLATKRDD